MDRFLNGIRFFFFPMVIHRFRPTDVIITVRAGARMKVTLRRCPPFGRRVIFECGYKGLFRGHRVLCCRKTCRMIRTYGVFFNSYPYRQVVFRVPPMFP